MHEGFATNIEHLLTAARGARATGNLAACLVHLREAQSLSSPLDDEHPLRAVTAWRRAKAAYDLGETDEMFAALEGVLARERPFADYPQGLSAAEPLARRWWQERGYGHPRVERLWGAFIDAWREAGDPWMAANGEAQLAWDWACSGRLEPLEQLLVRIGGMTPRDFGQGPSKHPKAADAATSLWFAQINVARTALRAAVWAEEESLAREAYEVYADALADADIPEDDDHWFLECVGRAELSFDWRAEVGPRWLASAEALTHERAELHRSLARGLVGGAPHELVSAIALADEAGPEWGIDLRRLALAHTDAPLEVWRSEVADREARFGVGVFRRPRQDPG